MFACGHCVAAAVALVLANRHSCLQGHVEAARGHLVDALLRSHAEPHIVASHIVRGSILAGRIPRLLAACKGCNEACVHCVSGMETVLHRRVAHNKRLLREVAILSLIVTVAIRVGLDGSVGAQRKRGAVSLCRAAGLRVAAIRGVLHVHSGIVDRLRQRDSTRSAVIVATCSNGHSTEFAIRDHLLAHTIAPQAVQFHLDNDVVSGGIGALVYRQHNAAVALYARIARGGVAAIRGLVHLAAFGNAAISDAHTRGRGGIIRLRSKGYVGRLLILHQREYILTAVCLVHLDDAVGLVGL